MNFHSTGQTTSLRSPWFLVPLAGMLVSGAVAAAEPAWQVAADGASVLDPVRKLVWDRCVHGQRWNGKSCNGEVLLLNHGEATTLAAERNRNGGNRCRLPSVPELQALSAHSVATKAKTPDLFATTAPTWRWSGTRIVKGESSNQYNYGNIMQGGGAGGGGLDVVHAWAVDLANGEARKDVTKRSKLPVQLVCSAP